jgi:hypothetical protein
MEMQVFPDILFNIGVQTKDLKPSWSRMAKAEEAEF